MLDPPAQGISLRETKKTSQVDDTQYRGWAACDTCGFFVCLFVFVFVFLPPPPGAEDQTQVVRQALYH